VTSHPASAVPETADLIEIGRRQSLGEYLAAFWSRREFAYTVAFGELKAQNQNTVLGSVWHVLNPLMLAGVYFLIFGIIMGARGGIENYPAFLIIGIITFQYTQKVVMAGTRAVVANVSLMQSISFPRALLPAAGIIQETFAQATAVAAMLVIVMLTGVLPSFTWLFIVPIVVVQALFNFGLSLLAARATFHFRDVQQFLPYLMRIWFYMSGIFFSVEFVRERAGETAAFLFELNPAYAFIELTREAVMYGGTRGDLWLIAGVWTLVAFVGGVLYFRASENEYSFA
jgi:teichoic acid transport system permease protein